jgi:2-dehydro-3-deoxygalactonokinase
LETGARNHYDGAVDALASPSDGTIAMTEQLLGIDWGTSNRRAYLVDAQGNCLASHSDARGMLAAQGQFAEALDELLATMQVGPDTPVVMSGMVGSAQGWQEAPYLGCEVALADLPRHLARVRDAGRAAPTSIVPGYCYRDGTVDVMRGEETQLLGAQALGQGDGWVVLPGTHSKWVLLQDGRIVRWATYMTGELFGTLAQHGTLAPLMNAPNAFEDAGAFADGLELARRREPLTHSLFTVRARVVTGALPASRARSLVSGLLIGTEFAAAPADGAGGRAVAVIGSPALAERYRVAASHFGVGVTVLDPDAIYRAALAQFLKGETR